MFEASSGQDLPDCGQDLSDPNGGQHKWVSLMTDWRPDAQTYKVFVSYAYTTRPSEGERQLNTECDS
jgi:hypothetical protein